MGAEINGGLRELNVIEIILEWGKRNTLRGMAYLVSDLLSYIEQLKFALPGGERMNNHRRRHKENAQKAEVL